MRPFHECEVWQLGHEITLEVYRLTKSFPREELYGPTSQMRPAAYSIPMNIVEWSTKSDREFHQALPASLGSVGELEGQTLLSRDLGHLLEADYIGARIKREKRMLVSFMKVLRARPQSQRDPGQQPMANGQRPRPGAAR